MLLAKEAEVYEAFGIPRATYYDHLAKGRLTSADNLIHAARHFGINPVDLLMRYGHLTLEEVDEVAAQRRR